MGVLHLCAIGQASDNDDDSANGRQVVRRYPDFPKLTSIHGNCTDELALVSGCVCFSLHGHACLFSPSKGVFENC